MKRKIDLASNEKIVWKVVRTENGQLESVVHGHGYTVEYGLNSITTPRLQDSKLFAFKTRNAAREFSHGFGRVVYKAIATNVEEATIVAREYWDSESIRSFWKNNNGNFKFSPEKTVTCDSIKLIEKSR